MDTGQITCPNCGHEFEISDALTGQIREHLKAELQAEITRREAEAKRKLEEIAAREEKLEERVASELKTKLADAQAKAAKALEERYALQMRDLQETLHQRDTDLKHFREQELALRKEKRELEKAREEAALELERKLDAERERIRSEVMKQADEQRRLKELEKDKTIADLKTALDEMRRKAEQGSMETQGEVMEQEFENRLRSFFPLDHIAPVPKGIRGADLVHTVRTPLGTDCGVLLWEIKNTKAWGGDWIGKLKQDMIDTRATLAILMSVALPESVERFGQVDGVWVSDPASALPLAAALREQLIALDRERSASIGKSAKMELLYQYLAGTEFKQKIEGIVEGFTAMQDQLARERRAMERQWNEREKQIERVIKNTVGLYGDMQGIIGGHIPAIPALELEEEGESASPKALPDPVTEEETPEPPVEESKAAPGDEKDDDLFGNVS
ncbi:MAG: DUF2130 domain-containing protein [Verrucomicrobiae bacterium]|nr:DUF2130 domain-containing protein [Verrucomicrobiae bacterium]